jgi:hypothetical protein
LILGAEERAPPRSQGQNEIMIDRDCCATANAPSLLLFFFHFIYFSSGRPRFGWIAADTQRERVYIYGGAGYFSLHNFASTVPPFSILRAIKKMMFVLVSMLSE